MLLGWLRLWGGEMTSDLFGGIMIGLILGMICGWIMDGKAWENESINHGYAHYDSANGQWKWNNEK